MHVMPLAKVLTDEIYYLELCQMERTVNRPTQENFIAKVISNSTRLSLSLDRRRYPNLTI